MHFLSQDLEDYIEQHSEKEPAHLAALTKKPTKKFYCLECLAVIFREEF